MSYRLERGAPIDWARVDPLLKSDMPRSEVARLTGAGIETLRLRARALGIPPRIRPAPRAQEGQRACSTGCGRAPRTGRSEHCDACYHRLVFGEADRKRAARHEVSEAVAELRAARAATQQALEEFRRGIAAWRAANEAE